MASRGFLGGTTAYDVRLPDLTGLSGFTAFWNLRRDSLVDAFCTATGFCPVKAVDGTTYLSAQATGTITVP